MLLLRENEYMDKVHEIFQKGGTLWFYERVDTNEFPQLNMELKAVHDPTPQQRWSAPIGMINLYHAFLTEEDAINAKLTFKEGHCIHCMHGGGIVETIITEHEFINKTK